MASSPIPPLCIEEPPSNLTVHLINPPDPSQSINNCASQTPQNICRLNHLYAFLTNLTLPILVLKCIGYVLTNSVVALLGYYCGFYSEWNDNQITIPNIVLSSILFMTIPAYLYEALILPREYSITLSLSTQQMTIARIGFVQKSLTIPLNQILTFSSRSIPSKPHLLSLVGLGLDHGCFIIAYTTGGPIKLGAGKQSYVTAVSHLNQFLLHHRSKNLTSMPYRPFRYHFPQKSPAKTVVYDQPQLPALSRVMFRETGSHAFKCVKRDDYPGDSVVACANRAFMTKFTTLGEFLDGIHAHALSAPLLILFLAVIGFCFNRLTPKQWIFSERERKVSKIRRILYSLFRVRYVPVGMYHNLEIKGRTNRGQKDLRNKLVFEEAVPIILYDLWFTSNDGESQMIAGFSEGEMVCLIYWLQRRFPWLFKGGWTEHDREGETKTLEEKKEQ